ncbi:Fe-S cluster assembly sulfur transfer protein SufU [Dokdonella sp.]|uniref:Fe-S cluster assembly sulfur transfer protein SufU n=1 Tax=Dokdonella sp. TaxID=2291710 RepID=UPI001B2845EF|nr:SUF system NifU family Fe-S cluster assembly protein [Dokdonella sp.]MBO9663225.1 SUF system NifU family Fe-S cluster assembly protein [Dokdonella sp.]
MNPLYAPLVLEHYRQPRGRGALPRCTHAADGVNPLCGDALRIELRCEDGRVAEFAFSGESCAITTATASMLGELVRGATPAELDALAQRFAQLIEGADEDAAFGPLNAMRALQHHAARRKCALLPWATLRAALAGLPTISTETEHA